MSIHVTISGVFMEDIKLMARAAKQRLKSNFWTDCKRNFTENATEAKERGISEIKVKSSMKGKVKSTIRGEKDDEFYLKVKAILDSEGEVSDAIGRLTDRELYSTLSYEEQMRYNLQLSNKYLAALAKWRKEKEFFN